MGAAQRNYYGKALARLAKERDDVVVLDADLAGSTKTSEFKKVAPERFVEVGIAEQRVVYELPLELFQSPYQVFLNYLKSLT